MTLLHDDRRFAALVVGALMAAAGTLSCSVDDGTIGPNAAPETVLTFTGPVGVVNSHLRLNWWGEDSDGSVMGYEYRWSFDGSDAGDWVFTAATTDSFTLPAPTGVAAHVFEVRAVDDDGAVDPSPAEQRYTVNNEAPVIAFVRGDELPTVSLPAVTIAFDTADEDGNDTVREVVAWLDGQDPVDGRRVPAEVGFITFQPDDFQTYGERTVFLRAVDDALAESEPISHTLTVVEPVGSVIVFDDMPDDIAGGLSQTDPFYRTLVDEVMAGEPYTIHKIENGPLRTPDEALAIFRLFDVVIWYQGTNYSAGGEQIAVGTASLRNAEVAIRDLLGRGGRLYLETMNAIGTGDVLSTEFTREVLGVERVLDNPELEEPDTNFFLKMRYFTGQETWWLAGRGEPDYGDVRVIGTFWGLELFDVAPHAEVLYTIPPDIVFDGQERVTVATRVEDRGTMIYFGFPLSRCPFQLRHRDVFRGILQSELLLPTGR